MPTVAMQEPCRCKCGVLWEYRVRCLGHTGGMDAAQAEVAELRRMGVRRAIAFQD
jgi:hypothetical protein